MRPPRPFMRRPRVRENVNEAIRFREVRAVFPDGATEVMPTSEAIQRAKDLGLDLILIAPTAQPPVAKAMDYGQWQYEEKKKKNEAKKKQHVIQVKEVKFRPNTDDHDYDFKKKHATRFLKEGNRVKAVVQFRGREIAHTELGKRLLERLAADLTDIGQIEGGMRMEGRAALMILSPVKVDKAKSEKKSDAAKKPPSADRAKSAPAAAQQQPQA